MRPLPCHVREELICHRVYLRWVTLSGRLPISEALIWRVRIFVVRPFGARVSKFQ